MKMFARSLIAAMTLSVAACGTLQLDSSNVSDQYDVAEIVVRELYVAPLQKRTAAICFPKLSDPSARFLNRLAPLTVLPCSALEDSRPGKNQVIEQSGQSAVTIYINKFERVTPDRITVTATRWRGSLSGGGYSFKFQRVNGSWQLMSHEKTWNG